MTPSDRIPKRAPIPADHRRHPWLIVLGLLFFLAAITVTSCHSLRRLQPPWHEPAAASAGRAGARP